MTDQNSEESTSDFKENGQFAKGNSYAFKPGQSGNPAGRSKSLSRLLREKLESGERGSKLVESLINMAEEGNMNAIKEIYDRMEGKPRQELDIGGDLRYNVTYSIPDNGRNND